MLSSDVITMLRDADSAGNAPVVIVGTNGDILGEVTDVQWDDELEAVTIEYGPYDAEG